MGERKTDEKQGEDTRTGLLDWLGNRKDALLVLVPVLYGLGYLIWSINALRNNLGWLPALDLQYFLAGIVPAAVLWATITFLKHNRQIQEFFFKFLVPAMKKPSFKWFARMVIYVVGTFFFISVWIFFRRLAPFERYSYLVLMNVVGYFYLIFGMAVERAKPKKTRFTDFVFAVETNLCGITAAACFILLYVSFIYPNLPQELGGLKPRRAYIDMAKEQISQQMLNELCSDTAVLGNTRVVRSKELNIFFAGSSFLLVRPCDVDTNQTHELQRNVVRAITWCDRAVKEERKSEEPKSEE